MKKAYETPKAEKYEFNYSENVVASGGGNGNPRANANSCWKQNGNNVNQGCGEGTGGIIKDP